MEISQAFLVRFSRGVLEDGNDVSSPSFPMSARMTPYAHSAASGLIWQLPGVFAEERLDPQDVFRPVGVLISMMWVSSAPCLQFPHPLTAPLKTAKLNLKRKEEKGHFNPWC